MGRLLPQQEPDEDDLGDSDEEAGDDAAAARAAGIDVRGGGAAPDGDGGGDGGGGGLNVQEMRRDAFWLQRRIAQAFGGMDADTAQALAEKVVVTLQVCKVPRGTTVSVTLRFLR